MYKRVSKYLVLITVVLSLTGCWDYVGANEITIVTSIAIDKDIEKNKYDLTIEIVDIMESSTQKTVKTKLVESTGDTIFDAVRNAKRRLVNKLYFSAAEAIIISNQIARDEGVNSVLNLFIRDVELRENALVIISKEESAKKILEAKDLDSDSVGFKIESIIEKDNNVTSSTKNIPLYQVYNVIQSTTVNLALPAMCVTNNDEGKTIEACGIATFKEDKLIGYIGPSESKYFLFIDDDVEGGIIPLKYKSDGDESSNISLEIAGNITKRSFKYENNKMEVTIETDTKAFIAEFDEQDGTLDQKEIDNIIKLAEKTIKKNIEELIEKAKKEYKHDIFCLSNMIYQNDPKLWKKIKKNWDKMFVDTKFVIKTNVEVPNTALIR